MKISLNEPLSIEFDNWGLERAAEHLSAVKASHPSSYDRVLNALFVALAFRQLEIAKPGTVSQLLKATEK